VRSDSFGARCEIAAVTCSFGRSFVSISISSSLAGAGGIATGCWRTARGRGRRQTGKDYVYIISP